MSASFQFETPENVRVEYRVAGLGTRFVAWFVDQLILWAVTIVVIIAVVMLSASATELLRSFESSRDAQHAATIYLLGLLALVWGLGSFIYFGAMELLMRGQTVGKRKCGIRVVRANGFQLDPASIVIRSAFRVLDHVPPLWIVPLLSPSSQRAGDYVAGTIVISDDDSELTEVRKELSARSAHETTFRFDARQRKALSCKDFAAIENILERASSLSEGQRDHLLDAATERLCKVLELDQPQRHLQRAFLEDLLASELRSQERSLG